MALEMESSIAERTRETMQEWAAAVVLGADCKRALESGVLDDPIRRADRIPRGVSLVARRSSDASPVGQCWFPSKRTSPRPVFGDRERCSLREEEGADRS